MTCRPAAKSSTAESSGTSSARSVPDPIERAAGQAAAEVDCGGRGGAAGSDLHVLRRGVVAEVAERAPEPVADGPGGIVALQGALDPYDRRAVQRADLFDDDDLGCGQPVRRGSSGVPMSSRSSAAMSSGSGESIHSSVAPSAAAHRRAAGTG